MDMDTDCCKDSICYILNSLLLYVYPCVVVEFTVGFPTFPLDAVVLLAGLVWQGIGAWLRQHVLWGACDPVLTLGVLGAQGARGGHALDLPTERTLAGAHSLAHRTARYYWILLGTMRHTHIHIHTELQLLLAIWNWTLEIHFIAYYILL